MIALGALAAVRERGRTAAARPVLEVKVTTTLATGGIVATTTCMLGDEVAIRATRASAVWIYRGDVLIASCPGPACREGMTIELVPAVATRHRVVAVWGPPDLATSGRLDRDVLEARSRGGQIELHVIDVVSPR